MRNASQKNSSNKNRPSRSFRPQFEGLENRTLFAVFSGIVNGQLQVNDTSAVDTVTLDHVNGNTIVNGASYPDSLITDGIHIKVGSGVGNFDTVNIKATGITTFVDGQFDIGKATLGANGNAQGIQAPVIFSHFHGDDLGVLVIDDSADTVGRNVSLNVVDGQVQATGLTPALVAYDNTGVDTLTLKGGSGGNTFTVVNAPTSGEDGLTMVQLFTGVGQDNTFVRRVPEHTTIAVLGQNGHDVVTVGRNSSTQFIQGLVQVFNAANRSDLIVDDSADTTPRTWELDNIFQPGSRDERDMYITGFNDTGAVYFDAFDVLTATVKAGSGGNKFIYDEVRQAAGGFNVVLNTGSGGDFTRVVTNRANLTINGQNGNDIVNVGSDILPAGSMGGNIGDITVTNAFAFTQLILNDAQGAVADSVTFLQPQSNLCRIRGLSDGNIFYNPFDVNKVNINGTAFGDTFFLAEVAAAGTVQINGLDGNDQFFVGSAVKTLDTIKAPLQLNGNGGFDSITIHDEGSQLAHIYTVTSSSVARSFNGPTVTVNFASPESLVLNKGPAISSPPLVQDLGFTSTIHAGDFATLTGHLFDSDGDTRLSLLVDWGDGSKPTLLKPDTAPFSVKHKFKSAGTYTVRAIWTDSNGNSNFKDLKLTVLPGEKA